MLQRFVQAQADPDSGFETAWRELQAGRKRSHWIWYIFPQLAGLGSSPMAREYGLQGIEEATSFLRHPLLRARLADAAEAVADHLTRESAPSLVEIAGSEIDAVKIVSSMTLFSAIAHRLQESEPHRDVARLAAAAETILTKAATQGIPRCAFTTAALEQSTAVARRPDIADVDPIR